MPDRTAPERLPAHWQAHYDALQDAARERTRVLGTQVAQQPPAWATSTLGAVPADPVARLEWETRAASIAAYREVQGWNHEEVAIGGPGKRTDTEKRALYLEAWDALGRPQAGRNDAGLTDGQLRVRVAAWEREQTWAPPHVDAALRQAELDADAARTEATLARAAGDTERADTLTTHADHHAAIARTMDHVAQTRAAWVTQSTWTRAAGLSAAEALTHRGLTPGQEPDRTTADEWLAADRAARQADDAHRTITENDLTNHNQADEAIAQTDEAKPTDEQAGEVVDQTDEADEVDDTPASTPTAAPESRRAGGDGGPGHGHHRHQGRCTRGGLSRAGHHRLGARLCPGQPHRRGVGRLPARRRPRR